MTRNQKNNNGAFEIGELKRQIARRRKLRLAIAAAVIPVSGMLSSQSVQAANDPTATVNNGSSDLTANATYTFSTGSALGATYDVVFAASTNYNPSAFTLNTASISVASLNDIDTTLSLSINDTASSSPESLTLNAGTDGVGGATGDLLYVKSGATLSIGNASTSALTLSLANSGNIDNAGTLSLASPISITAGKTITFTGAGTTTVGGNLAATTGAITINDASGSVTLSGTNSQTGTTTLTAGTLKLSGSGTLASTSAQLTVNGGILDLNGTSQGVANFTGTGGDIYNLSGAGTSTLTIGDNNGTGGAFAGVIADNNGVSTGGSVAVTKAGSGTITLSGADTYSGGTTINGGTLVLGTTTAGSLASGSNVTFTGTSAFTYQGRTAGSTQTLGTLLSSAGDDTVTSTYGTSGTTSLAIGTYTRSAGATTNFVTSGGTNGTNNLITLGNVTANTFISPGTFFGTSSYAFYDSGGFVRALNYTNDATAANTSTQTGAITALTANTTAATQNAQYVGSAGTASTASSTTSASTTLPVVSAASFAVGEAVTGTGIATNTYVTAISSNTLTLSAAATVTSGATVTPYNNISAQGTQTVNTLNLSGAGASVALSSGATLTTNGILRSGELATGAISTITGGTSVTAGGSTDFVIATPVSTDLLTITTPVNTNGVPLVKSGAGGLTLGGAVTTTAAGSIIDNAGTLTINGTVSGAGSITVNSTTALALNAPTNTFTGGIVLVNANVSTNSDASLGTGTLTLGPSIPNSASIQERPTAGTVTNAIIVNPGTAPNTQRSLSSTNANAITFSGTQTLNNGATITYGSGGGSSTISGAISGTGNVNVGGIGTVRNGATLLSGSVNMAGMIVDDQTFIPTGNRSGGTFTISGQIGSNVTGIDLNTPTTDGALVLSNASTTTPNTFFGDTTLTSGTVNVQSSTALQNSVLAVVSATNSIVTFGTATTTHFTAATVGGLSGSCNINLNDQDTGGAGAVALTIGNSNTLLSGTNTITNTAVTNTLNPVYSGVLSNTNGAASVTKVGTNTQTFAAANSYTGGTTVSAGELALISAGTLGATTGNLAMGGGLLDLGGSSQTVGAVTITAAPSTGNTIQNGSLTATSYAASNTTGTATVTANLGGGSATLAKSGAGTLTLSGSNSFGGNTSITAGTLNFQGSNALPASSAISVGGASTLGIANDGAGSNGTISLGNSVTLTTNVTSTINVSNNGSANTGNTVAFGALSNNQTAGTGTFDFTGANGYLVSFSSLALPGVGGQGTTLVPTSTSVTITGAVTNPITTTGATHFDTLTLDGTSTGNFINGAISDSSVYTAVNAGDTRVTKSNTSTWTLAGASTYHGPTAITGGTLILTGSLANTQSVTTSNAAIFSESSTGSIGGTATFTQGSSGTSTLAGANTFSGATTITGGTLALVSGGSLGNTSVAVGSSTSSGALQVNGNYTIGSSAASVALGGTTGVGTLSFPNSESATSTLTITNTSSNTGLTLGGSTSGQAVLNLNLGNSSTDQITTGGKLVVTSSGAVINLTQLSGTSIAVNPYTLISYATSTVPSGIVLGTYTAPSGDLEYLTVSSTAVTLNEVQGATGNAFWTGSQSSVWNTNPSGTTNFVNAATSGTSTGLPVAATNVFITAKSATNLSMTLGQGFTINSLNFTGTSTSDTAGATIAGSLTPLTIEATNANGNTAGSGITVAAGSGANTISAPIILDATQTWTNNSANTLSVSGVISGSSPSNGLTFAGTGGFTLSAAETYSGPTVVSGGTLNLTNATAIKTSSSVTVNSPGLLAFGVSASESGNFATGVVIQGSGGITNNIGNGNTAETLDRANTYTGQTTWENRGIFRAGIASAYDVNGNQTSGAFGVNSAVVFNTINQETLELQGFNNQVGSLAGTVNNGGGVQLLGATLTIGGDNTSTTYTGPISNNYLTGTDANGTGTNGQAQGGDLVKIGNGTQTFVNSTGTSDAGSSYEGTTTIKGGVLSVNLLGTSGFVSTSLTTNSSTSATVGNAANLVVGQYVYDVSAIPVGTKITAINGNTITLSAASSSSATYTAASFGYGSGIGISSSAASNLVLDGGTLQYTGAATSTDRLFTVGSTEAAGATGTLDASGTGALNFTNTGALAYGTAGQARTLVLTGTNTGNNALSPAIGDNGAGAVSLVKAGAGTWIVTNANSYTGGTTISAGKLQAIGTALGTGSVTVAGGTIAVNDGVTTTAQTLTTGDQTWKANSGYTARVFNDGSSDEMLLTAQTGTLTFDSSISTSNPFTVSATATAASLNSTTAQDWVIAGGITTVNGLASEGYAVPTPGSPTVLATAGASAGSSAFVLNMPSSLFSSNSFTFGTPTLDLEALGGGGYSLDVVYNATPEPGTALLVLAGGLPMLTSRRRRRNAAR
jgi:fibronectin-binding autotransporter adhesin